MRNLLDKTRVAQSLDGNRLTGSLLIPGSKIIFACLFPHKRESNANVRFGSLADIEAT